MIRVKICGITNLEDALFAVDAGAHALGFVFYKKSPRFIEPKDAKAIVKELPPFVESVGLFVNSTPSEIDSTIKECNLGLAQIHFDADSDFYNSLKCRYIRVVRAKSKDDILSYQDEYRLVDAFVESFGGEGKRVDPSWFDGVDCSKIILAGGLNEENVTRMCKFGFYGVDVSSGVEKTKGKKDRIKLYNFIKAVNYGNI